MTDNVVNFITHKAKGTSVAASQDDIDAVDLGSAFAEGRAWIEQAFSEMLEGVVEGHAALVRGGYLEGGEKPKRSRKSRRL